MVGRMVHIYKPRRFLFSDEEIEFYVVLISINNNLRIILNPFRLSNL
ncbi:hypothetical protein NEIELOOT_01412 [Neisseria elongata subsp. glycolytica ATCC 29315]|uniref:Uncharacterized protein n=1 Tax=Neisseria elongata subsp. glycolytica ATCC 29315 TaxID=546263 RepID=D4DQS0_NEIEG|nr:hypothetical protein NEIELOOT_01412 [Neisseria elongata subsp. glycolytica ATCC 29315]